MLLMGICVMTFTWRSQRKFYLYQQQMRPFIIGCQIYEASDRQLKWLNYSTSPSCNRYMQCCLMLRCNYCAIKSVVKMWVFSTWVCIVWSAANVKSIRRERECCRSPPGPTMQLLWFLKVDFVSFKAWKVLEKNQYLHSLNQFLKVF